MKYLYSIFFFLLAIVFVTKSAGQGWRLSATAYLEDVDSLGGFWTLDSTKYYYNYDKVARGSSAPYNDTIRYDRSERYVRPFGKPNEYKLLTEEKCAYNSNNTVDYKYTFKDHLDPTVTAWTLMRIDSNKYNNSGLLTYATHSSLRYYRGVWQYLVFEENTHYYTPQNILYRSDIRTYDYWGASTRTIAHFYTYDAHNNLIADSLKEIWAFRPRGLFSVIYYSYDTADYLTMSEEWIIGDTSKGVYLGERHFYYYDTAHRLLLDSIQSQYTYPWQQRYQEAHYYTYYPNDLLAKDSFVIDNSPDYYMRKVTDYTYTSFGYVDRISTKSATYNWPLNPPTIAKYYYELYWPIVVMDIMSDDVIQVYPIPTSNLLHIRWEGQLSETVQGSILNAQGQVINQWQDEPNGNYHKQIATDNLAAGIYFLQLKSDTDKVSRQFVITR